MGLENFTLTEGIQLSNVPVSSRYDGFDCVSRDPPLCLIPSDQGEIEDVPEIFSRFTPLTSLDVLVKPALRYHIICLENLTII